MSSPALKKNLPNGTPDEGQKLAIEKGHIMLPGGSDVQASGNGHPQSPGTTQSGGEVATSNRGQSPPPNAGNPNKKGPVKLSRKETAGRESKDAKIRPSLATPMDSAIDPLSHHIFVRTNTDRAISSRLRGPGRPESPANEPLPRPSSDLSSKQAISAPEQVKDKRKAGSFLSRLSMIGNKKKGEDADDGDSEISDLRTEGANAIAFSSDAGGAGYIPHHKEPPRYIRVRAHSKKAKEFDRMFLAQELVGTEAPNLDTDGNAAINGAPVQPVRGFGRKDLNTGGPVWAIEFSKDGKYMATAGRDRILRIWAVIATQDDRKAYEEEFATANAGAEGRLSAPVFRMQPIREFAGHTGEVLDLSWSKNNFLLSSSMDKTVRLWHISRDECLCTFKHKDFVTSIAFHPKDDRFFLAGSLDSILRLWSIPDKSVAYSIQIADLITAVAFSPDGKTCIAGCLNGLCTFYETEGLKFETQMYVRSSRGKNAKGSKITGIQTMASPPDQPNGQVKVLVTSNDSRIRIYNLRDKALELKFKGHENTSNQIRASFSDDGSYVICGSEDKKAFIWSTGPSQSDHKDKRPCEHFEAHSAIVTQAVFAPTVTRELLQTSHDPIFTLCNPPPVTLLSKEEASMSQTTLVHHAIPDKIPNIKKPEETPAFIARSKHHDGNIMVTTDHSGIIKVFRQDCAFIKRRHDNWETGSTFSRTLGRDGLLGRTGSVMTRTSAGSREPRSRRGSITQSHLGPGAGTPQLNSERIMSWRQNVEGTPSRPNSIALATPARSERSMSPAKARTSIVSNGANLASEARRQPYASSLASPPLQPTSPTSSVRTSDRDRLTAHDKASQLPPPSFTFRSMEEEDDDNALRLDPVGASYSFWNLNRWRGIGNSLKGGSSSGPSSGSLEKGHSRTISEAPATSFTSESDDKRRKSMGAHVIQSNTGTSDKADQASRRQSVPAKALQADHLAPPGGRPDCARQESAVSTLTSEGLTSAEASDAGDAMQCSKCGGHEFKAKKVGGQQRFLCSQCGRIFDA
ncbi:putative WD repeat-containing protein C3H5.08c [Seiridium cardinale]|uniref:WD repeat-containing protein C3H5.08c n=1 Tax=Seiridium cardinale TaxID=138064 RepID=A0ABR2XD59_9PEZI